MSNNNLQETLNKKKKDETSERRYLKDIGLKRYDLIQMLHDKDSLVRVPGTPIHEPFIGYYQKKYYETHSKGDEAARKKAERPHIFKRKNRVWHKLTPLERADPHGRNDPQIIQLRLFELEEELLRPQGAWIRNRARMNAESDIAHTNKVKKEWAALEKDKVVEKSEKDKTDARARSQRQRPIAGNQRLQP